MPSTLPQRTKLGSQGILGTIPSEVNPLPSPDNVVVGFFGKDLGQNFI